MALSLHKQFSLLLAATALLIGLSIQMGATASSILPAAIARANNRQAGALADCGATSMAPLSDGQRTLAQQQATHADEPAEGQGQIIGHVTDLENGEPVTEVVVNIYDSWGNIAYQAFTDEDGGYVASGLTTGSYHVEFLPGGVSRAYPIAYYNQRAELAAADAVRVTGAQVVRHIDARLTRGGIIRGCVSAAKDGAPLTRVSVEAYNLDKALVALISTDLTGAYELAGLPLDGYRLKFAPYGKSSAYVPEYYVDQATWEEATTIALTAAQREREIHATLVRGGSIHGQVRSEDQQPLLTSVTVSLLDRAGRELRHTQIDARGYYTFTALATDAYRLAFTPFGQAAVYVAEYYHNQPDLDTATLLTVTAPGALTGVDERLARGSTLSGEVTNRETGAPLGDVTVVLYSASGAVVSTILPNSSGNYTFTGVASGDYRIGFLPFGYAVGFAAEYYQGKSELAQADHLIVETPTILPGIDAALLLATPAATPTIQATSPPVASPTATPTQTPTPDGSTIIVRLQLYLPLVQR